jgi:hypothetical protein
LPKNKHAAANNSNDIFIAVMTGNPQVGSTFDEFVYDNKYIVNTILSVTKMP